MVFWLAYRPFIDPLPIGNSPAWSLLCVPLVVLVALAYKTIKLRRLDGLPRYTAVLCLQILVFFIAAAAVLWVLTLFV